MFNIFKKFISSKPKDISNSDNLNTISIILEKDKDPYVYIGIQDTSTEAAQILAKTLFDLNKGEYADSMIKILMSISEENNESKMFIAHTISQWSQYTKIPNNRNNEPLVKPTDFFKKAKYES